MSNLFSSLDVIPSFHAVMTHGSLSAAARQLGLAHPTVRRHIETLEDELGVQLFTRSANGLTPTQMAHSLMPAAAAVLEEAGALRRIASGSKDAVAGTVRITCSRVLAGFVLPDILGQITRDAPDLRFELVGTDSTENLLRRAADIGVRFVQPTQQALIAKRLPDVELGLFAAPSLPLSDRPIEDLPFIADDRENRMLPAMAAAGMPVPRNIILRSDDPLVQIAHLRAGVGVGICQVKLAARLGLVRVSPETRHMMPCWLIVHEDQARLRRIAYTFDALKTHLPHLI
ncbi:LysR family transcriptional regulator [Sulfitobacter sp.]|jgi:DNA-binding transcriptional LysR family regulator|uniref:LysR family transcriptional regulator n=1 Tax=Sulfitobacter sp. TaxID=1903071 RepID=UPI0039E500FB